MAAIFCSYCNFTCRDDQQSQFLTHLFNSHANEPNFKIYCNHENCTKYFKKVKSLQKHWQRDHAFHPDVHQNADIEAGNNQEDVEHFDEETSKVTLERHAAKFLLAAKEGGRLTQKALDTVKESTQSLVAGYLGNIRSALQAKLRENDPEFTFTEEMQDLFDGEKLFEGVETEHMQRAYYIKNFNLVEPVEIELGKRWKYVTEGGRRKCKRKPDHAYYVPVLKSLEVLINNPDVLNEVENHHQSQDNFLRDITDGSFCTCNHPIFSQDKTALQLIGYYDDLEVANPLGSKAKIHKIGVFYYVLGNIRPCFRSTSRVVQLIAVAKTKDIKQHGLTSILSQFTSEINKLSEGNGYSFNIAGKERLFRGGAVLWTGDTLGSNFLAGYKEGVGGALRICRHCMATRMEANMLFKSSDFQERELAKHLQLCALIEDPDNSKAVRERLSTTYGINGLSVLQSLTHFDVCKCFPEDIMHILFEGIVPYETKLLLKHLIDETRCFTLKRLNQIVDSFDFGYMNKKNKPSCITRESLNAVADAKLKQSASQMWCLFRFLPIILGDYVDEDLENWLCIRKLWNIVQICTSRRITADDVAYLRIVIEDHHKSFAQIYPESSIIPKMHYLIHVADDMIRFGPAINLWTMRFEAKHSLIKGLVSKNFKNVPKSIAYRHQRNMCWNLLCNPGQSTTTYLYQGDDVKTAETQTDLNEHHLSAGIYQAAGIQARLESFIGSKAKWVLIRGVEYRLGCVVRLAEMTLDSDQDYPIFGQVDEILVWEDEKMFVLTVFNTVKFCAHYMSYQVERSERKEVWMYNDLPWHGVLHLVTKGVSKYVADKDTACVELL